MFLCCRRVDTEQRRDAAAVGDESTDSSAVDPETEGKIILNVKRVLFFIAVASLDL
jgi:hypothetical protein